jgi:hypothetical protein
LTVALAFCGVFALAGCGASYAQGSAAATSGAQPRAAAASPSAEAILARLRAAPPHDATVSEHTTMTAAGSSYTADDTVTVKLQSGTATVTSTASGEGGAQNTVTIDINGTSQSVTSSSTEFAGGSAAGLASFEQLSKPELVGAESVDGVPTYHLRGTLPPEATADADVRAIAVTADLWVRQDTSEPVKLAIHATGEVGGTPFTLDSTARFLP